MSAPSPECPLNDALHSNAYTIIYWQRCTARLSVITSGTPLVTKDIFSQFNT